MNSRNTILVALLLILNACVNAQDLNVVQLNNVEAAFNSINPKPKVYNFKSKYKAPAGGHLQGIQAYRIIGKSHSHSNQIVITGSSNTYSYYVTVDLNGQVDSIIKIKDAPLRHAGGCQILRSTLFVGIEDNIAKDTAQLMMIGLADTFAFAIKTRQGQFKRSTAGALGVTSLKHNVIISVGDWDTRNIDFYSDTFFRHLDFIATFSFGAKGPPCSYQSINLLSDTGNHLYLIGLGKEGNRNRADLFLVENYKLTLVATRLFKTTNGCSFRYGAGINCKTAESLQIYTCQRRLTKNNKVNVFETALKTGSN